MEVLCQDRLATYVIDTLVDVFQLGSASESLTLLGLRADKAVQPHGACRGLSVHKAQLSRSILIVAAPPIGASRFYWHSVSIRPGEVMLSTEGK